jgi:hypothetical protein
MKKAMAAIVVCLSGVLLLTSSPPAHAKSNSAAFYAWYQYPISQYYNGASEMGEDLGTPRGTPITSLVSGRLAGAGFYAGGGVVSVRTTLNGATADLYVQHLDSIVNVGLCQFGSCGGQYVYRGELLGYSGGDCHWHYGPGYGNFNPCAAGLSYGPHTEVGINPPWSGIWGPYPQPGPNYNPYRTILALSNG